MPLPTLNRLQQMCRYISIQTIRIESEVYEKDKVEMILKEFQYDSIELVVENSLDTGEIKSIENNHNRANIRFINDGKKRIKDRKIELFPFLYSEYFNPCLGHQIAVDANGDIKPCLWFDKVLGNIEKDDLKAMIIGGNFDIYWDTHKMKIEACKDCELRRVCDDCRADVANNGNDFFQKPSFCDYDPYTGEGIHR
jgi:radical SAM protein with 4Fe4S-binding SPASM domain